VLHVPGVSDFVSLPQQLAHWDLFFVPTELIGEYFGWIWTGSLQVLVNVQDLVATDPIGTGLTFAADVLQQAPSSFDVWKWLSQQIDQERVLQFLFPLLSRVSLEPVQVFMMQIVGVVEMLIQAELHFVSWMTSFNWPLLSWSINVLHWILTTWMVKQLLVWMFLSRVNWFFQEMFFDSWTRQMNPFLIYELPFRWAFSLLRGFLNVIQWHCRQFVELLKFLFSLYGYAMHFVFFFLTSTPFY
jgi:hypothetical protein